jgi:hypothetical protein
MALALDRYSRLELPCQRLQKFRLSVSPSSLLDLPASLSTESIDGLMQAHPAAHTYDDHTPLCRSIKNPQKNAGTR